MLDLVVELCFFLRSRWRVWLRPLIIFLLVIGGSAGAEQRVPGSQFPRPYPLHAQAFLA